MQVPPAIGDNSQADHAALREGVRAVVSRFGDEYWLARDEDGDFPREFHARWPRPAGSASPCRRPTAAPAWASPRPRS